MVNSTKWFSYYIILTLLVLATVGVGYAEDNWTVRVKTGELSNTILDTPVPIIPDDNSVTFNYWEKDNTSYADIAIMFPTLGFNVSDWGNPMINGSTVTVNAQIWRLPGLWPDMIWSESHTYSLGNLSVGQYSFVFMAWYARVETWTFGVVPEFPSFLISSLFMLSLIAVAVLKRKITR